MANLDASTAELLEPRWTSVGVSRTIAASPDQIWETIADGNTWLDWYRPMSTFEVVGGGAIELGATLYERESLWKSTSEVVVFQPGARLGTSTATLNLKGLLKAHYRDIALAAGDDAGSCEVTITGGFRFGLLGWALFPYTYPQMTGALWFEYRSALKGLAAAFD